MIQNVDSTAAIPIALPSDPRRFTDGEAAAAG
jgi:hypothetical protein